MKVVRVVGSSIVSSQISTRYLHCPVVHEKQCSQPWSGKTKLREIQVLRQVPQFRGADFGSSAADGDDDGGDDGEVCERAFLDHDDHRSML